jgi:hypothetical protein
VETALLPETVDQIAPAPDSHDYTRLVWAFARERAGRMKQQHRLYIATLPEPLRNLSRDPWVRRFLECAARDAAGQPLGGGARGEWLKRQRHLYASGAMPKGRAALLDRLVGFTWTPDADRWGATYDQVAAFVDEHGRIPSRGDDSVLAAWLAAQRLQLRTDRLDPSRAESLARLPGWRESLSTARARVEWEARLAKLARFQSRYGFYPDRTSDNAAEAELGRWAHQQRGMYQRSDLSAPRIEALETLPGWRWRTRDATFDRNLFLLRRELMRRPIPRDHPSYKWVESQRRRHQGGRLSEEQSAALEALGMLDEVLPEVLSAT